jgi:hypothetical protein
VIEGRVRDERKTQPNQRELDHHSQRTERGSERTERGVIWVNQDGLERGIGLWEEWGVLRLGMVSEGGEYGSNPLSSFKSGRNEEKSTGK